MDPALLSRVKAGYRKLADVAHDKDLKLLVQTYYGDGDLAVKTLTGTGVDAFGVDTIAGGKELPSWTGEELLVVGVVDGRNIWRTDLDAALDTLKALAARGPVAVSTSASLLHVPYTLDRETTLSDELRSWLAFGAEKIQEVALLSRALRGQETEEDTKALAASREAVASRKTSELTHNAEVRERTAKITEADRHRGDIEERRAAQKAELNLPPLPTTTIGSFPQTTQIRQARAALRKSELTEEQYNQAMIDEIADVIKRQEDLGLDVLVHGEPERNDMVQYLSLIHI